MNTTSDIDYPVPFFSNTPDDTHCFQAVLRMILKYFYPNEEYSWDELDKISAKVKDLWTWPTASLIWLQEKGLEEKVISPFDYTSFIEKGGDFLIEKYGEEVGKAQIQHSVISQEQILAEKLLQKVSISKQIPMHSDIYELLEDGYVVTCNINSLKLNNREGYIGHFIIIKGISNGKLIIHDPGLPPLENRHVEPADFESAWAYPNEEAKDIYAFKLKSI